MHTDFEDWQCQAEGIGKQEMLKINSDFSMAESSYEAIIIS